MPTDANGVFSLPAGYQAQNGQTIEPSQHNTPLEDIATGLTARLPRNGAAPMTGPLDMAGFRVKNIPDASVDTDPVAFGQFSKQIQDQGGTLTLGGTATAYTLALNTAPASLADGLHFVATANVSNTGGATTLVVTPSGGSAFASKKIKKIAPYGETDPLAGDLVAGGHYQFQYDSSADGGNGAYILLNPALAGRLIQRIAASPYTSYTSTTVAIPADNTVPQITEGLEYLNVTITPKSTTNRLLIRAEFIGDVETATIYTVALFQDTTANALTARPGNSGSSLGTTSLVYEMAAGTISATTFHLRAGPAAGGTLYVNGTAATAVYGGVCGCNLIVEEYA